MDFELGFSKGTVKFQVDDKNLLMVMNPNPVDVEVGGRAEVARSLREPIGAPRLDKVVKPGEKVVIITSDVTRPGPSYDVLPPLLDELSAAGIQDSDITVVFALGAHRPHTEEEKVKLVGQEVYDRVRCIDSNPSDCVHLGTTDAGTPVDVFSVVANAERLICIGNIEFHYFAGYSGGAKAIMPGVSTHDGTRRGCHGPYRGQPRPGGYRPGRRVPQDRLYCQRRPQ